MPTGNTYNAQTRKTVNSTTFDSSTLLQTSCAEDPRHTVDDARCRAGDGAKVASREDVGLAAVVAGQSSSSAGAAASAALTAASLLDVQDMSGKFVKGPLETTWGVQDAGTVQP